MDKLEEDSFLWFLAFTIMRGILSSRHLVLQNLRFRPSTRKQKAGVFKTFHSAERV